MGKFFFYFQEQLEMGKFFIIFFPFIFFNLMKKITYTLYLKQKKKIHKARVSNGLDIKKGKGVP